MTNFNSKKPDRAAKTSDHNTIFVDFHFKIKPEKVIRKEIYLLRDPQALKHFKEETTHTTKLTNCFASNDSLDKQVEKWLKVLKSFISKTFKKVRICNTRKKKRDTKTDELFEERRDAIVKGEVSVQE